MRIEALTPQFDTSKLPADAAGIIEKFDDILQNVRPLNSKQLQQLPDNIRNLSHQLTDQRASRRLGYMNETVQLISYVRYYTWWNLVRLTRLFSNLPAQAFPQSGDTTCLDLGSGPLTVVTALWLSRPELRELPLCWYCLDVSANSMQLGEDIYLSVVARTGGTPWKIIRVKGSFGTSLRQKANFVTCANMFNELDQASDMPPEFQTKKYFSQLCTYSEKNARFLLIEPGVPKAARTLSLLRDRFIKGGSVIAAPCPHAQECPMSGFKAYTGSKNKWCNFAFSTQDAPSRLQKLSEKAKLPKERATLSYISVIPAAASESNAPVPTLNQKKSLFCRVTSDEFRLPHGKFGHYACSIQGLTLLQTQKAGEITSGDLIEVASEEKPARTKKTPDFSNSQKRDEKSGAIIISL
ncbi:MAG: small ribosomal subunit Rsm22 family protein [Treponema sp.]|nr:small ribosomal subunit Rsm22 family protein [Treponema sp.]